MGEIIESEKKEVKMIDLLNKSIQQLREVNSVLELCEKLLKEDDTVMNTIYEASANIDNAANAISTVVGREILAKSYYSQSLFKINGQDDDDQEKDNLSDHSEEEAQSRIDHLRRVVDQVEETLNNK